METSGPTSQPPIATSTSVATSPVADWKIGQLLLATVIRNIPGNILLSIGNRQVRSESSLSLQPGQVLKLLVQSLGDRPLLSITHRVPTETPASAAIRVLLPKQGPITPLLAIVKQLARAPVQQIPTDVIELARTLHKQLADTQVVSTPKGLKQALRESGVFTERLLLQSAENNNEKASVAKDFKINLLRLLQGIRNGSANAPLASRDTQTRPLPLTTTANTTTSGKYSGTRSSQTTTDKPASTIHASNQAPKSTSQSQNTALETSSRHDQNLAKPSFAGIKNSTLSISNFSTTLKNVSATSIKVTTTNAKTAPSTTTPAPPFRGSVPVPQPAVREIIDQGSRAGSLRVDLLLQTEAAIARLQMNQLAALPRDGERGLLEWLFDLPVRRGDEIDLWSMRWFRDHKNPRKDPKNTTKQWTVQLAFDLPGLGPVQVVVRLNDEQVSTHFFAENQATVPLFNRHLDELRQSLLSAGLDVDSLECTPGCIPEYHQKMKTFIREQV